VSVQSYKALFGLALLTIAVASGAVPPPATPNKTATPLPEPNATGFNISSYTIDAGGGDSAAGAFEVTGTAGQPDAGVMTGGSFELSGGFWPQATVPPLPDSLFSDSFEG